MILQLQPSYLLCAYEMSHVVKKKLKIWEKYVVIKIDQNKPSRQYGENGIKYWKLQADVREASLSSRWQSFVEMVSDAEIK